MGTLENIEKDLGALVAAIDRLRETLANVSVHQRDKAPEVAPDEKSSPEPTPSIEADFEGDLGFDAIPEPDSSPETMSQEAFREAINAQFRRGGPGVVAKHLRPLLDRYAGEGQGLGGVKAEDYPGFLNDLTKLTDRLVAGE